jgi:2-isopropylmalate synthase
VCGPTAPRIVTPSGGAGAQASEASTADLFSVVAALETKAGRAVLPEGKLATLGRVAHAVAEVANIPLDPHTPWVGASAFAHKAGLHVSAIKADPDLYQHADPSVVGNDMRLLMSELAGRATVELKGKALGLDVDAATAAEVLNRVKDMESVGWSFEAADASFELLLREALGKRPRYFELESWRVIVEHRDDKVVSEATVKLTAHGARIVATGEGNGPVNALDNALRQALLELFPALAAFDLVDYKVRIVSGAHGTDAVTRVLVDTTDGLHEWSTVGVHENVIEASWHALEEAYTAGLLRHDAG